MTPFNLVGVNQVMPHLSEKQQFWLNHIQQAYKTQLSLADYAKQHSLELKRFYNARSEFKKLGLLPDQKTAGSHFTPVKVDSVNASPSQLKKTETLKVTTATKVILPNGVEIHLSQLSDKTLQWLVNL